MRNYEAKSVDFYIANSDEKSQLTMEGLRKLIKSSIPNVEEGISWGVPFYKHHGLLAGFAVFKNHVSFGLAFVLENKDRKILEEKGYTTGKKTIQIKFNQKIPTTIIKRILKTRAKMNEAKR
jgi:uncharacterized protein